MILQELPRVRESRFSSDEGGYRQIGDDYDPIVINRDDRRKGSTIDRKRVDR